MINYFLQKQKDVSLQVRQLLFQKIHKRQYQPFHIDCQNTKKKICYCVNNPVLNVQMDPKVKQKIWQKYDNVNDFYLDVKEVDKQIAQQYIEKLKKKIQCLSRKQVADYVRSIKKQKSLIGQTIEY